MVQDISKISPLYVNNIRDLQTALKENREFLTENSTSDNSQSNDANNAGSAVLDNSKPDKDKEIKADYKNLGSKLSNLLEDENVTLEFKIDDITKKIILRLIDSNTKEVLQQYPPEISLKIARIVANTGENGNIANAKV